MTNISCSPLSRRGVLRLGLVALAGGFAGCGSGDQGTATPGEKPASESGPLKRLERVKGKMGAAGKGKT